MTFYMERSWYDVTPFGLDEIYLIQAYSTKMSILCPIFYILYLTYIGHNGTHIIVNDLHDSYRPTLSSGEGQLMKGETDEG